MTPKEPKINEKFIMNIKGKDFVLYSGLLDLAHQRGIKSIHVEPVQYPTKDNGMEAICKSIVISSDGQEFTEIGDANPRNVNSMIREHILRMSATRAKARALRDMSNIGMTCLEELGDLDQIIGGNQSSKPKSKVEKPVEKPKPIVQERGEMDEPQQQEPVMFNSNKEAAQQKPNNKPVTSNSRKETTKDDNIQKTNEAKVSKTANPKTKKEETKPQQTKSGGNVSPIKQDAKMSIAQKNAIMSLAKRRGIAEDELSSMVADTFNLSGIDYLTSTDASSFIRQLQQAA